MVSKPVVGGNRFALSRDLTPTFVDVSALKPIGRETRKHPLAQLRRLEKSLEEFGFVLPILIDREDRVIAGWGLALAAKKLSRDS